MAKGSNKKKPVGGLNVKKQITGAFNFAQQSPVDIVNKTKKKK